MQKFYKGRTNNHLTWVMVDATDFATPESALSAATKIKIYGKLRGATGVNFVSSGTGSLTNDIQHVGASALGIYTIALAKADLSDASAAWYDQYIISLSATGAAYQMLVVDGGIDDSNLSGIVSDLTSALLVTQSMASDAASAAQQANSRVLLNQSRISDIASFLVVMSGIQSDIYSALSDLQSDFQSRVPKRVATDSQLSDLASDLRSVLIVNQSAVSDLSAVLSDLVSDFQSRVPKRVATDSQLSDLHSDLRSFLVVMSGVQSDAYSLLSDLNSNILSRIPAEPASRSQLSDLASDLRSVLIVNQSAVSDLSAVLSDFFSDFQSRVPKRVATDSQLSDVHSDLKSAIGNITVTIGASDISDIASAVVAALPITSAVSDIYSLLSDLASEFLSRVPKRVATDSQLSDLASDVKSAVIIVQSMASDAASAAQQGNSRILLVQSRLSDFDSRVASDVSDIYSLLSDLDSNFGSRVPKRVATDSQLSDLASDLKSAVVLAQSLASDAHSAAAVGSSRALQTLSQASDIYSLLSDLHSDVGGLSGVASDVLSLVTAVSGRIPAALTGDGNMKADALAIDGDATSANRLAAHAKGVVKAIIGSGSTTTAIVLDATTGVNGGAPSSVNDFYNGRTIVFTSGALANQATDITDYDGATKTLTVTALTGAPLAGVTAVIV